jgi:hypothetical protein
MRYLPRNFVFSETIDVLAPTDVMKGAFEPFSFLLGLLAWGLG